MEFRFKEIEEKVKEFWEKNNVFRTEIDPAKPKYYVLDMFPYPSGAGLHVGHPLGYVGSDIIARYKRLKGFNVLHPMGYDSFGLPAEQYAIQTGQHPAITTEENIKTFRSQMDKLGFSFDWSREVRTSDPKFYQWTQWIFIQLFHSWYNNKTDKAEYIDSLAEEFDRNGNANVNAAQTDGWWKELSFSLRESSDGIFTAEEWQNYFPKQQSDILLNYRLAYIADSWVNWCAALGTVLANDEVKDGVSERGGYPVERKLMKQWSLRITAYAERLLNGLDTIDWSESIKETQRNWIGRSEGCSVLFQVSGSRFQVEVFTTRPDTIFGASYIALAPEHELVENITTDEYREMVNQYVTTAKNRSERDRMADVKKVTGQFTGAYALHPFTGKEIPIWIADYVLAGYGTGAIMAVPGHDERDHRFASHFKLPIPSIIEGMEVNDEPYEAKAGKLAHSEFLDGLEVKDAIKKAIDEIERRGIGKRKINFKMRDAIFGRQRYWGEPIPIYYDEEGIPYTVDEDDLPLILPEVDKYLPTESGESPLARAEGWKYSPTHSPSLTIPKGGRFIPPKGPIPAFPKGEGDGSRTEEFYETANKNSYWLLKGRGKQLKKSMTPAEKVMWNHLRGNGLGEHFRRQHIIDNYIVDFICLKKKLVIEIDGGIHHDQKEEDKGREDELRNQGYRIIRFTNEEVIQKTSDVLRKIKDALNSEEDALSTKNEEGGYGGEKVSPFGGDLEGATDGRKSYPLELTTMPGWAGSCWYYLRYEDPHNENEFASKEAIDYWKNVDFYIGGDEHATGHLLYFRFWTKFLFDLGLIPFEEPAKKLLNQGKIQGISSKLLYDRSPSVYISEDRTGIKPEENTGIRSLSNIFEYFEGKMIIRLTVNPKNPSKPYNIFRSAERINESNLNRFTKIRVENKFVNGDVLDLRKFVAANPDWIDSVFVCEGGYFRFDEDGLNYMAIEETLHSDFKVLHEVEKMSKRYGNVVDPSDVVADYGADAFRLYEMFLGPIEQHKPWDTKGIDGVFRFLKKFWRLFYDEEGKWLVISEAGNNEELKILHRAIKKATEDIERLSFNTSVSAFMICVNELTQLNCHKKEILEKLLIILSPYAPFVTEYLWEKLGHDKTIIYESYPQHDDALLVENSFEYPVAVNGKTRVKINFALDLPSEQIEKEVLSSTLLQKYFDGKTPKKVIVVKGRMINVVV